MKKIIVIFTVIFLSTLFTLPSNAQPSGSTVFQEYPWLSELIDEEQCADERVDVYASGIFSFVLVTDSQGQSILYNQDGQFYCRTMVGYDCVSLYNLDTLATSWTCNSGVANCEAEDQLISRLIQGYDSDACYVTTSVSQLSYEGKTYFRTYRGRTRKGIERSEFPCYAQEFFGEVRDCNYTRICAFGLFPSDATMDVELCTTIALGQLEETTIWSNPDSECPDIDPFDLPVIKEAINIGTIIGVNGEPCEIIKDITKMNVYGFTYYKISEFAGCASDNADRFFDCEGNYVGGIGFAPLCQSPAFCTLLNNAAADGEVIWSAGSIISNDQIFADYPWLTAIVDRNNCTNERVDVYRSGGYIYLIVTGADQSETMYNAEGAFYCQSGQNLDCRRAYDLGSPIDSWVCGDSQNGSNSNEECETTGTIFFDICGNDQTYYLIRLESGVVLDPYLPDDSNYVPVDGEVVKFGYTESDFQTPCALADLAIDITCLEVISTPSVGADCANNSGTIFFADCDDGTEYFFMRTSTGEVLDIYLAPNLAFNIQDGQAVDFDFIEASFLSPCSIADQAVIVTCIEETAGGLFDVYPFLNALVDQNDCTGTFVNEYQLGGFNFIYVGTSDSDGKLFRYDGVFYCESTETYNCIEAYGFEDPIRTFSCSNQGGISDDTATNRSTISTQKLAAFPNPTSGEITIRWSSKISETQEVHIIDISGRSLQQLTILPKTESLQIDMSGYQRGIYFIESRGATERYIVKLIKQ